MIPLSATPFAHQAFPVLAIINGIFIALTFSCFPIFSRIFHPSQSEQQLADELRVDQQVQ